jgi:hypothetical protein
MTPGNYRSEGDVAENQYLLHTARRLGVPVTHEPGDFEFRGVLQSRTKERITELEALLLRLRDPRDRRRR